MMETKEISQKLHQFVNEVTLGYKGTIDLNLLREAADRLEELEELNERWCEISETHKERFSKLHKEIADLKKQLSEQRPEWISVEDEPIPGELYHVFTVLPEIIIKKNPVTGEPAYWMRLEPPKPKELTFKDAFLRKFPKAQICSDGSPIVCRANVFGEKCLMKLKCSECWNQPYFEEEEGGE